MTFRLDGTFYFSIICPNAAESGLYISTTVQGWYTIDSIAARGLRIWKQN
jgi:hypothetical protein